MGLPEIIISFQRKADTAIRSGSRGMVAVVLDDTTKNQMLTPYRRWRDVVQEDWTKESLKALELVFKGSPQRVVAVRLLKDEETPDLAGTLKEILPLNIDYLAYPAYTAGDKEALPADLEAGEESEGGAAGLRCGRSPCGQFCDYRCHCTVGESG